MAVQSNYSITQINNDTKKGKETFYWDDMLGPLISANLDVSSGRIDYDYFNGAIAYQNNARYPGEPVAQKNQFTHRYMVGTNGRPHMHWKQQSVNIPNWLLAWKLSSNGEADIIETDFSNYNLEIIANHVFTYTSGVLNQISVFPEIDLSTANISDNLHIVLFRDSANTSGLFAGADPSGIIEYVTDLDTHIQLDRNGSEQEYTKEA